MAVAAASVSTLAPGCGKNNGNGGDGGLGDALDMGIHVSPNPANLDLNLGGPAVSQMFAATAHLAGGDQDVTGQATWTIDDTGLGSMVGPKFTSGIMRGGSTYVRATFTPPGSSNQLQGEAILNVKFHAGLNSGCPGCPPFPGDGGPSCQGVPAPQLVYPPDGVLLPPNMNVIAVHFVPANAADIFEIDFLNNATDVRIETVCNPVTDSRGNATGGCSFTLDPTAWNYVAQTNRAGDPVMVVVREAPNATPPPCANASTSRTIAFAQEDLNGGIYYWQSVVIGQIAGEAGGIYRHDFGDPTTGSQPFITPGQTDNKCYGCHFLSREGLRMTVGSDDADSDDEYDDLHSALIDVATTTIIQGGLPPGFQAFSPDHKKVLFSDGSGQANPPIFSQYDGDTGGGLPDVTFPTLGGKRVTQPDWTKDGTTVYFVVPGQIIDWPGYSGGTHTEDDHFLGGSIFKMSFDLGAGTFGMPTPVVMSGGGDENDYYPAVSPDGHFLVWNRAMGTDQKGHDCFNNPGARLWALNLGGGTPVDMMAANGGDGLTNSWPRWSPFIQTYKGKQLLWVTFSSTRDYGLRVRNQNVAAAQGGPLVNCYPPDSPENPCTPGVNCHHVPFAPNCNQPQIWMAAVSLSDLELAGGDPSFPAFWLPFQDDTAHNHIAQWVETVVGPPPGDGGACQMNGQACSATMPCCPGLLCNGGRCGAVP